jgi:hypothetical protein
VRVVAALRLYHLDHRTWPATLEQLVGPYLKDKPVCYNSRDGEFDYQLVEGNPLLRSNVGYIKKIDQLYPFKEME